MTIDHEAAELLLDQLRVLAGYPEFTMYQSAQIAEYVDRDRQHRDQLISAAVTLCQVLLGMIAAEGASDDDERRRRKLALLDAIAAEIAAGRA